MKLFFLLLMSTQFANATTFVFKPTGLYYSQSESASEKVTSLYYDLGAGFLLGQTLYVGGISQNMNRDYDSLGRKKRSSYGASVGLLPASGAYLIGHYFTQSSYEDLDRSQLKKGTGLQVDLGFHFSFSQSIRFGPQLTYRSFKYKEQNLAGVVSSVDISHHELLPFFSLMLVY